MSAIKKAKIERYYSKIAVTFIALVILTVAAIVYFSLSKTVITVTPRSEEIKNTMEATVGLAENSESADNFIEGRLTEKTVNGSKEFTSSNSVKSVDAKSTGTVTMFNKNSSGQSLVATTRLLSDSGVLFRTKENVIVPANGEITIEVEADTAGSSGDIAPSRFTVVALKPGMQEKVYGESTEAMSGGTIKVSSITAEEINKAKDELAKELKSQATAELARELSNQNPNDIINPQAVTYQVLEENSNKQPGDETDKFEIKSKIKIIAVIFDQAKLYETAKSRLSAALPANKELTGADISFLKYGIKSYNLNNQIAILDTTLTGSTFIKLSSPIFDRNNLTNRDRQEIVSYFTDFPEIQNAEVKFSPFWVFRSSALKDHIVVRINK